MTVDNVVSISAALREVGPVGQAIYYVRHTAHVNIIQLCI